MEAGSCVGGWWVGGEEGVRRVLAKNGGLRRGPPGSVCTAPFLLPSAWDGFTQANAGVTVH